MKIWLSFLLATAISVAFPQTGSVQLKLSVMGIDNKVVANTPVNFTDIHTGKSVTAKTDAGGRLSVKLDSGYVWQIDILQIRRYPQWLIQSPPHGVSTQTVALVYDYHKYLRETEPPVDRTKLSLQTVPQKVSIKDRWDATNSIVQIQVNGTDSAPVVGLKVNMVCYKLNTIYTATTNKEGVAFFKIPTQQNYQVDLDNVENYSYLDLKQPGMYGKKFLYVPTTVKETHYKDTIRQTLPRDIKNGTTARELAIVSIKDNEVGPWKNEKIYLREANSNTVYEATTDETGTAKFLVPKGKVYLVDFRGTKSIDAFDFTVNWGVGYTGRNIIYTYKDHPAPPTPVYPVDLWAKTRGQFRDSLSSYDLDKYYPDAQEKFSDEFISCPKKDIQQAMLFVELIAPEGKEAPTQTSITRKDPSQICMVVDQSGSMSSSWEALKASLIKFVGQLKDEDMVSLVLFNDFAYELISPVKVGANRAYILDQIRRINIQGGTIISSGLQKGFEILERDKSSYKQNFLVLFTDYGDGGDFSSTIAMARKHLQKIEYVGIGIGTYSRDYKQKMADSLNARSFFPIERVNMEKYFAEVLNQLVFKTSLQDFDIRVKVPQGIHIKAFSSDLDASSDFHQHYNEVDQGQHLPYLFEFTGNDAAKELPAKVTLQIRFFDVLTQKKDSIIQSYEIIWRPSDDYWDKQVNISNQRLYVATMINRHIEQVYTDLLNKNVDEALAHLHLAINELERFAVIDEAFQKSLSAMKSQEKYLTKVRIDLRALK